MPTDPKPSDREHAEEFQRLSEQQPSSLLMEFLHFVKEQKKWWLIPLLVSLAVYAAFLIVSISSGPVFIYRLF
jgi:hypothetical protein